MRFGVGGGKGFSELTGDAAEKRSSLPSEAFLWDLVWLGVSTVMDLMNVTWQISVYSDIISAGALGKKPREDGITHLYAVKRLAVELLPPLSRPPAVPKLHGNHIPTHLARHDHPVVTDIAPPLLSNKPQEVARRHVAGHSRNAQDRALFLTSPGATITFPGPIPNLRQLPQRT
jgi:hypothetical protein